MALRPGSPKVVLLALLALYLVAVVLAAVAEQQRSTATTATSEDGNYSYCKYNADTASGLGGAAIVLAAIAQIVVGVAGRCFCCGSGLRPGGARALALILFLLACVSFVIGEVCLLAASVANAYHTNISSAIFENPPSCDVLRKGVFAAGAAFTFLTAIFNMSYYHFYTQAHGGPSPYHVTEVGMT